jgi:hypothetical protein
MSKIASESFMVNESAAIAASDAKQSS